jgi:hypothetical protein
MAAEGEGGEEEPVTRLALGAAPGADSECRGQAPGHAFRLPHQPPDQVPGRRVATKD